MSGHNVEITRLNRKPDLTPSFLLKKRQEGNENISTSVSNRYDRTLTDENETAEAVHTSNEANNLVQAQVKLMAVILKHILLEYLHKRSLILLI